MYRTKLKLPSTGDALPGRSEPLVVDEPHFVSGHAIKPPFDGMHSVLFGMGCFWGAERLFWEAPGVHVTAVGYAGGTTPNPTYEEVCTGLTGHTEVVLVVWDPKATTLDDLLKRFWEGHDPTQGMQQGNDVGTQYRSAIYVEAEGHGQAANRSLEKYQASLRAAGHGDITTEIGLGHDLYYAESYHQQYLAKNPSGYCGLGGTGVTCPVGLSAS